MADEAEILAMARTPAEAKRHWMIDRLWIGSLFSFALLLFLVGVIWLGTWPEEFTGRRLSWLGLIALFAVGHQFVVALSFSLGGPVGRWRARWGDKSVEADDDATAAYDGRPGV